MTSAIDLNADVGESFGRWQLGDDEAMLSVVTSANVACGFHAGDPSALLSVCRLAAASGVAVGAQVGYRDLVGFGRRFIDVEPRELTADVVYQIGALDALARMAGTRVSYVKPHGALYHAVTHHEGQSAAVVEAVRALDPTLALVGLPGSLVLRRAADAGLHTVKEAFADRAYLPDGALVPRSQAGALITDADLVAERMVTLVAEGYVTAVDGTRVRVEADSLCVHGDSPGAVSMAQAVAAALAGAGVRLAPFATASP